MRRWTWAWAWAGTLAVFVALMVVQPLPPDVGRALSYGVQSATILAACVLMAARARTARGALRRARALLSASMLTGTTSSPVH